MNDWSFKHSHHPNLVNACVRDFQFHFSAFHPLYPPQNILFPICIFCLYFSRLLPLRVHTTNDPLWMLLSRYISSLISLCTSHFPHFDEYLNDFYRMKNTYRNRIILHSTTWIIVHHFIGDWEVILKHKSAYLIDPHECQHTQLGFQNQLMESFFHKKIRRATLGLGLFVYFCMIMSDIE